MRFPISQFPWRMRVFSVSKDAFNHRLAYITWVYTLRKLDKAV